MLIVGCGSKSMIRHRVPKGYEDKEHEGGKSENDMLAVPIYAATNIHMTCI
jgi:hypothetical protein